MAGLEEIARIARDMPITDPKVLGQLAVRLSEVYAQVAEDSRQAFATVTSSDIAQRLRVAVQQLGTANIELVKIAGQRRAHPHDQARHFCIQILSITNAVNFFTYDAVFHLMTNAVVTENLGRAEPWLTYRCRTCASSAGCLASSVERHTGMHKRSLYCFRHHWRS